ncbi:gfo/Idh/MocA family oxidoreductase [Halorubrum sp. 48-1-W]|uniref:Gfo/Idh/MocA family protein n=1 Tax=Halorubrum sp. 48-1-W TaxID=2249761 RepID=UPI000DCD28C7|nr:Gfo/Idh/MocA family oxidoreductase [Halorubrum sp. 48-1-W]RAW45627.1 gfo/Idh/MocA family oxidoreductase [Halorubrum sp. 48-1-W]
MTVDVGVIGVGSMGGNHARVYAELPDANLVGIADANVDRAEEVAGEFGTTAYAVDELIDRVDAASVAVPTQYHADVAGACIDAGVHVLVEKPFVDSPEAGRELLRRADEADVTVQVGHIERFSPAVTELSRIVRDVSPIAIDARRLGPPTDEERSIDDGVVHDLMIHDLDVVRSLVPGEVVEINALCTDDGQHANAQLRFDDGTDASLTASRVTQKKVRDLTITAESCYIELDYLMQDLEIHRQSRPEYMKVEGNVRYQHEGITERPMIRSGEPLRFELESFVESVANGTVPRVTGADGLRAIELADAVRERARGNDGVRSRGDGRITSGVNR